MAPARPTHGLAVCTDEPVAAQLDWRPVYDFWFPVDLSTADVAEHWRMLQWWMRGGANAELPQFAAVLRAAGSGQLNHWLATPHGRLSLIIVLDQFPRGLYAGTPDAYSSDPDTPLIVEEGFRNGHYDALVSPYERSFYFLPLAHVEGPDHLERMQRVVAVSERMADEAPAHLKPVWDFSLSQAQANLDVISRFGRFPHRNPVLGRISTPQEGTYLEKGEFVHRARRRSMFKQWRNVCALLIQFSTPRSQSYRGTFRRPESTLICGSAWNLDPC